MEVPGGSLSGFQVEAEEGFQVEAPQERVEVREITPQAGGQIII